MEDNHSRFGTHVYMNQPIQLIPGKSLSIQIGRSFMDFCVQGKKLPPCLCNKSKNPYMDDYLTQLSKQEYRHQLYVPMHIHIVNMDEYERLLKKYAETKPQTIIDFDKMKLMKTENTNENASHANDQQKFDNALNI